MRLPGLKLRAISPVIAMILVAAITLAVAFAVGGWVFGLWGGLAGGLPQVSITNTKVYYDARARQIKVELYVINKGPASDKILKVEVIKGDSIAKNDRVNQLIKANERKWVTVGINPPRGFSLNTGDSVLIKVYMENSGVYSIPAIVSPG